MKELKKFQPAFTGGTFVLLKDEMHALAMNDQKVTLFNLRNMKVLGTLAQENEEISTFAISPNQQYLATSNRSALIRIFKLPERLENQDFSKLECISTFKTANQLVLEMTFDPSSKFLAVGTSDSHIKVFDVARNFQTHNFTGHRGII